MKSREVDKHFDVVIIGAGIAGLTCGALLAKKGNKVLIVEKNPIVGGYCSSFHKDGFIFDVVSILLGCGKGGKIYNILEKIGVAGNLEFVKLQNYLTLHTPDNEVLAIPPDRETAIENLSAMFPSDRDGIQGLFQTMEGMYRELYTAADTAQGGLRFLSSPFIRRYGNSTYKELLDEFIQDRKLQFILSAISVGFGGMSSERVSALYISNVIMTFFLEGGYLPVGGMQRLPDEIAKAFCGFGGTVTLGQRVGNIIVNNGAAEGVSFSDGTAISSSCIISNTDARQTFSSLIDEDRVPVSYREKLKQLKPSPSAFVVNIGVDMDLNALPLTHQVLFFSAADPDEITREVEKMSNGYVNNCIVYIPTLENPSLAPHGRHIINLLSLPSHDARQDWTREGKSIADQMVRALERLIPNLTEHIVHISYMTPDFFEHYTLNSHGAWSGWSHTPEQFGMRRLPQKTPVKGLFLAGHWTAPGGGVTASMISGVMTSAMVEGYLSSRELVNQGLTGATKT